MKNLYIVLAFLLTSCFSEELLQSGLKRTVTFTIADYEHQITNLKENGRVSAELPLVMELRAANDFEYNETWLSMPDTIEVDIPNNITQLEVFFTTYPADLTIFNNIDAHFYTYHQLLQLPLDEFVSVELKIASAEIEVDIKKPERIKNIYFNCDSYVYNKELYNWVVSDSIQLEFQHKTPQIVFPVHINTITLTRYLSDDLIIDVDKYLEPGTKNVFNIDNRKAGFRIAVDSLLIENKYDYKVSD